MRVVHRGHKAGVVWASLAGALAAGAVALTLAPGSSATVTFTFSRLGGVDRYDTARIVAEATYPSSAGALLATGTRFADALSGGYAAGFGKAPILLTLPDAVPSSTTAALHQLGVKRITILGGPDAVSTGVQAQLTRMGYVVGRLAGADRYQTAEFIAGSGGSAAIGTVGGKRTALLASGEDAHFADALSASPMAYADRLPILLTTTASLSPAARDGLSSLGISQVLIIGGPAAVSSTVADQITAMGISVQRLGGADRTDTAARVADFELGSLHFSTSHVNLARGDQFPDALSGGPHAGQELGPIVLTEDPQTLGSYTAAWLASHAPPLADGHVFGGSAAVSDATMQQAQNIVRANSLSPGTTTTAPTPPPMRLVSVSARAGTTELSVTYSSAALCLTVAGDGSDYRASIVGGATLTVDGATCTGVTDATVGLTLQAGTAPFASGQTVEVVTQTGSNGSRVRDATGNEDPQGDTLRTTAS